ncbi:MAG: addiction module protein [Silvibacterium sp.]
MSRNPAQLLHEALELPAEARAALADSLLNSLDTEIDIDAEQAWREEIERRLASLNQGTAQRLSWDEVQSHFMNRLQR